ncbi:GNAT family N-acetyltransferase [Streptomyces mutabilis]|uniref:GNAT family N-acetyltransferase n=1 Tax=Streptomyces mutabilis TaxID=67332 RepID=UPI001F35304F|nr:GNAT family N-acetyltransferase [Streptomyces mutabilis]
MTGGRMDVLIRPARATEAGVLSDLALRSKAHWGYDAEFLDACRDELTVHADEVARRRTVVADGDGRVLGFTTLEGEPPVGVVGMMFVEPRAIGLGVGRRLFEHTVAVGRELGFTRLTVDADPHAEPFYRAMGAVRVGHVPSGSIAGRALPQLALTIERRDV